MPKNSSPLNATTLLSVAVGLFLLLSGVQTLLDYNTEGAKALRAVGGLFGADQTANVLTIVFAILKVASGAVLMVGPFGLLVGAVRSLAFWVIVGFWAALTIWVSFFGGPILKPTPMAWIQNLSLNIAILAALWQLKPSGKA
jgi:hypothetical protein